MRATTSMRAAACAFACALSSAAFADAAHDMLTGWERAAREQNAQFAGFSAQRGQQFFNARHGGEWSCASCHNTNPAQPGLHARTQKKLTPMAPAANANRFTDAAKVEKWFDRSCKDVLGRVCTKQEQGDVLAYLLTVKPQAGAQ